MPKGGKISKSEPRINIDVGKMPNSNAYLQIISRWSAISCGQELVAVSPGAEVASSQLERETCLVGDGASVSDRTSVRSSVLGPHTSVRPRTRLLNCVLMSGAKIGEG